MKSTEIPKGEIFTIAGKRYKIENNLLLQADSPSSNPLSSQNLPDLKPELHDLGKMQYYRLESDCYILLHRDRYPCFDSYDRMYENRYFNTYYICLTKEEMQQKYDYLTSGKLFIVNLDPAEKYRKPLLPYVYSDDGSAVLRVYETAKSKNLFAAVFNYLQKKL